MFLKYKCDKMMVFITADEKTALLDSSSSGKSTCCHVTSVCGVFTSTFEGWRHYLRQDILPAGIALALLYMTVLGFDNITNGQHIVYLYLISWESCNCLIFLVCKNFQSSNLFSSARRNAKTSRWL